MCRGRRPSPGDCAGRRRRDPLGGISLHVAEDEIEVPDSEGTTLGDAQSRIAHELDEIARPKMAVAMKVRERTAPIG